MNIYDFMILMIQFQGLTFLLFQANFFRLSLNCSFQNRHFAEELFIQTTKCLVSSTL